MLTSPEALLAIFGMALVTFAIKAGGLLLTTPRRTIGAKSGVSSYEPSSMLATVVPDSPEAGFS